MHILTECYPCSAGDVMMDSTLVDYAALEAYQKHPAHVAVADGVHVGFITLWKLDELTFLEHFVTYPAYRNQGYGRQVLALLKEKYPLLVLEAEHPDTELAARRLAFYGRMGFVANNYPYIQPSYHGESAGVPLVLMSYPKALENPAAIAQTLYKEVYKQ